ncbi:MAG: hypothetical protein JRI55_21770, partial [Deltaproteobacteria bacterium]|nr:hypothetical protein [Deltaproteobacteria bacterium]
MSKGRADRGTDAHAAGAGGMADFRTRFRRWSKRVRAHLAARRIVAGIVIGLVVGAPATAAAWKLRQGDLRPWMAALGLAGAAAGAWVAQRKRWSDGYVALYLDRKLGSDEAISTAVDLGQDPPRAPAEDAVRAAVVAQAARALEG